MSEALHDHVLVSVEDGVGVIALNRTEKKNAITRAMRSRLIEAINGFEADASVGAVLLRGVDASCFSSGMDLEEARQTQWNTLIEQQSEQRRLFEALRSLTKPSICAIDGHCVGAGFHMSLVCDLRYATARSRWGQPEVKVGIASIIGPMLMRMHIGEGHIASLTVSGKLITGQRAYDIGLVSELVEPEEVFKQALSDAKALATLPKTAMRVTKQRNRAVTQPNFDAAYVAVTRAQIECMGAGEREKMIGSFLKSP